MRILFVSSSRTWGGGEVWLDQISNGLKARGHEVMVACQPRSRLLEYLRSKEIDAIPILMSGDFNPITMVNFYRIIKSKRISLVCVNMEKELRQAGIAAKRAGIPLVISREVDFPIKDTKVNRLFFNSVASGVMVNSYSTANTLLISAPWLKNQSLEVVWKGVDCELFRSAGAANLREEFRLNAEDCVIGFVGRLDEQKGIPTLLSAMKIAVQKNARLKLILAGEGNLSDIVNEYRSKHNLEGNIIPAGFRRDIPSFMKAIDFLVMPSYWEGFGYTAVEAMAAGKAVIGSSASSLPEIIEHGCTGLLVAPRSAGDLAEAMLKLSFDPKLAESLGKEGYARAAKLFPLSRMIEKTELYFKKVVETYPIRNTAQSI